ncbi:MAG: hypothetical protein V3U16_09320, partial [Candidatus Neomarinimicrobiota bacterium]
LALLLGSGLTAQDQTESNSTSDWISRIPFTLKRNKIILPVTINGSDTIDITLDTGMPFEGFYLYHEEFIDELDLENGIEVQIGGAGEGEAATGIMYDSVSTKIGDIEFADQLVIISKSKTTQYFPKGGVTGKTIFKYPVVGIDYEKQLISLENHMPRLDSSWTALDIWLNRNNIPYINTRVMINENEAPKDMRMYIDLAVSEFMEILVGPDDQLTIPGSSDRQRLGTGLSGDIYGVTGRISAFIIDSYEMNNVISNFSDAEVRSKQPDKADGIIGNGCLQQFNIYLDYTGETMYLKPNKYFTGIKLNKVKH